MLLSQAALPEKLLRIEDLGAEVTLLAAGSRQRRRISVRPAERRTLALELGIVLCTPLAVLRRDGAS